MQNPNPLVGATILHYKIVEELGSGGMGVVYRARDTRLHRPVALKFISSQVGKDPKALERLRREARAASALNHPGICTIYDIDERDGEPFIVMELLEGKALKEIMDGRPMDLSQSMDLAIQIADALDAAHSKGLIHRDIKPGNIFVSPRNHVKVLDFGLAKFSSVQDIPSSDPQSTVRIDYSVAGEILGTPAYMSPEQARGDEIDRRSDLFSFGVILYEMVAGMAPFAGKTATIVFDAILNRSPKPLRTIRPGVPAQLETLIERMLEKDRDQRIQDAATVRTELDKIKVQLGMETNAGVLPKILQLKIPLLAGAVLAGLILAIRYLPSNFTLSDQVPSPIAETYTQLTSQSGMELFPSLTSDGKSFVYASASGGNWNIFFQRIGGQPINLTADSPADDTQPVFSPSGEYIAFRSEREGGGIFVMGATGESARRVTDFGYNPDWSPQGTELVVADESFVDNPSYRSSESHLWIINISTGQKRQVGNMDAVQPRWSPHGQRIAYWTKEGGERAVWTIGTNGTAPQIATDRTGLNWNPVWSPDGRYLYFSSDRGGNTNLWRVRIDEQSGAVQGAPEAITTGGGVAQRQHMSISADGKHMAYVEELSSEGIFKVAFDAAAGKVMGAPTAIRQGSRRFTSPDVSPDGQWIAYSTLGNKEDIFVVRSDGTAERQLTNDDFNDRIPRWSPDGKRLVYYSNRSGTYELWSSNADGSNLEQITRNSPLSVVRSVWSPDGNLLAGFYLPRESFVLDMQKNPPVIKTRLPALSDPNFVFKVWAWSPSGEWISGNRTAKSTGAHEGVILYSVRTGRYTELTDFGEDPTWLNDNRRLLFYDDGKLYIVDRSTKQSHEILSLKPGDIFTLGQLPKDNRFVYYSLLAHEADVWLTDLK